MNQNNIIIVFLSFYFISAQAYEGSTLFSAYSDDLDEDEHYTQFIDNYENIIHSWTHGRGSASMPYLLQDSTLIYPYRVVNPTMFSGGVGGGLNYYNIL